MPRAFLMALPLLLAVVAPAAASQGPFSSCQRRVVGAGEKLTADRRHVLAGCVAAALRCPGALAGRAAADDACLAHVARRCTSAAPSLAGATARVDVAGPRCTLKDGLSPNDLLGDDGLAFAQLTAFCPARTVDDTDPGDVSRCQRETLVCTEDAALLALAPHAASILAHLGMPADDGASCLGASLCGNGEIDGDEECDDGPDNSDTTPDACRTTCLDPICGDGVVDTGEDCDDGNLVDGDGCASDCTLEADVCGNGVVEGAEECDDGNVVDGDGCASDCTLETDVCGNGILEGAEECDDGTQNSDTLPDHCRKDCTDPVCGDGVVDLQAGEQCEPPGSLLCDDACQLRLAAPLGAARTSGDPAADALAGCQAAVLALGTSLFSAEQRLLDRCVLQIAHCVLEVSPNDDSGNRTDACLARAQARCDAAVAHRTSIEARFTGRMVGACPVSVDRLVAADGLGFGTVAQGCTFTGGGTPTVDDLVGCVVARTHCLAENTTARTLPLAYDMLSELSYDPDTDFPCMTDPLSVE